MVRDNKITQPIANKESREETSWNNAAAHSAFVERIWQKACGYYQVHDYKNWWWTLLNLRRQINNNLVKTERDNLDKLEKTIWTLKGRLEQTQKEEYTDEEKNNRRITVRSWLDEISKYQYLLLDLMTSAGYLPGKTDRSSYKR